MMQYVYSSLTPYPQAVSHTLIDVKQERSWQAKKASTSNALVYW
jgi:hypothetical protein